MYARRGAQSLIVALLLAFVFRYDVARRALLDPFVAVARARARSHAASVEHLEFIRVGSYPGPISDSLRLAMALAQLSRATSFTSAYVGFSGSVPLEVRAWGTVLRSRGADSAFKSLLETATPAGQLFALTGIYLTDPAYFRRQLSAYRGRSDTVHTIVGCIATDVSLGALVPYLANGHWSRELRAARVARRM